LPIKVINKHPRFAFIDSHRSTISYNYHRNICERLTLISRIAWVQLDILPSGLVRY